MKFKIDKAALDKLDDEILIHELALPIGDKCKTPTKKRWTVFTANPHMTAAQMNVAVIGDTISEVLNGGLFQLIMNPTGALIPDIPTAFRAIGRVQETEIFEAVVAMFPNAGTIRDYDKRVAFASSKIVPGGWEGLSLAKKKMTPNHTALDAFDKRLGKLLQSRAFFSAVATYVRRERDSFAIVERPTRARR